MIHVNAVSKTFRLYKKPIDRLKEAFLRKPFHILHKALNEVSFQVDDGETLGIIGMNGAGKSTLLKILTGVLILDSGSIEINGKVTGLLELGTGFNTDLTGLQNIYINGMLLGMGKSEIDHKLEAIKAFAELDQFIFEPMRTYSSGMFMRLAFAIAIHAEPKCFLVDEALSVGDAYFQQKCINRIKAFRQSGGSIIFVSHDMNAVKMLCDRAILLDHGNVIEMGNPDTVVNAYNYRIAKLNDTENRITIQRAEKTSYGTLAIEITEVSITGEKSRCNVVSAGEMTAIGITFKAHSDFDNITLGILLRDKYGQDIFGTNSYHLHQPIRAQRGQTYQFTYTLRMDIGPGKYTVTVALHTGETHVEECYHWYDHIADFTVAGNYGHSFIGLCKLYPTLVGSPA